MAGALERGIDSVRVERLWLPFAIAWTLTAWMPLSGWALPDPGYLIWGPFVQRDSLAGDIPLAMLCSALYLGPWLGVVRSRTALSRALLRAAGTGLLLLLTSALLALAPQNHIPPGSPDACW